MRRVTLAGAMSGGAWRVWIFLEGWLGGLVPTMFTWRMRKLVGEGVSKMVRAGPRPDARPSSGSASLPAPLPVVGEGVEVRYFHGAGVRLVGDLVNQQPLLSLPDYTHLEKGDTLRPVLPAMGPETGCSEPQLLRGTSPAQGRPGLKPQGSGGGNQTGPLSFQVLKHDFMRGPEPSCVIICYKLTPVLRPRPGGSPEAGAQESVFNELPGDPPGYPATLLNLQSNQK